MTAAVIIWVIASIVGMAISIAFSIWFWKQIIKGAKSLLHKLFD